MEKFKTKAPAYWGELNSTYKEEVKIDPATGAEVISNTTLAKLLGSDLFSAAELDKRLSAGEKDNILIDKLRRLQYPLAALMLEMAYNQKTCTPELRWNLKTGAREAVGVCSDAEKAEAKEAIRTIARNTGARVLYRRTL